MKVLIAGLGSIGQRHARNLRALFGERVDLLAYRVRGLEHVIADDMTIQPAMAVEQAYGIRAFDDLDAALAERPLATIVCNPTSLHLATAMAAVRAGSHVLIEKPISSSPDGVCELVTLAESRRLIAAVGYQLRFHPMLLRIRQWLADQSIGRISAVDACWHEYLPDAHPYEDYRDSYAARAVLGGGVVLCYSHELDYLQWLFGMPTEVRATGSRSGTLDVDVEDSARISWQVNGGTTSIAVSVDLSFASKSRDRFCEISGDRGRIRADLFASRLTMTDRDGREISEVIEQPRSQLFVDELEDFFAAIAGGPSRIASAREGIASLRIALAAKASMQRGIAVSV